MTADMSNSQVSESPDRHWKRHLIVFLVLFSLALATWFLFIRPTDSVRTAGIYFEVAPLGGGVKVDTASEDEIERAVLESGIFEYFPQPDGTRVPLLGLRIKPVGLRERLGKTTSQMRFRLLKTSMANGAMSLSSTIGGNAGGSHSEAIYVTIENGKFFRASPRYVWRINPQSFKPPPGVIQDLFIVSDGLASTVAGANASADFTASDKNGRRLKADLEDRVRQEFFRQYSNAVIGQWTTELSGEILTRDVRDVELAKGSTLDFEFEGAILQFAIIDNSDEWVSFRIGDAREDKLPIGSYATFEDYALRLIGTYDQGRLLKVELCAIDSDVRARIGVEVEFEIPTPHRHDSVECCDEQQIERPKQIAKSNYGNALAKCSELFASDETCWCLHLCRARVNLISAKYVRRDEKTQRARNAYSAAKKGLGHVTNKLEQWQGQGAEVLEILREQRWALRKVACQALIQLQEGGAAEQACSRLLKLRELGEPGIPGEQPGPVMKWIAYLHLSLAQALQWQDLEAALNSANQCIKIEKEAGLEDEYDRGLLDNPNILMAAIYLHRARDSQAEERSTNLQHAEEQIGMAKQKENSDTRTQLLDGIYHMETGKVEEAFRILSGVSRVLERSDTRFERQLALCCYRLAVGGVRDNVDQDWLQKAVKYATVAAKSEDPTAIGPSHLILAGAYARLELWALASSALSDSCTEWMRILRDNGTLVEAQDEYLRFDSHKVWMELRTEVEGLFAHAAIEFAACD